VSDEEIVRWRRRFFFQMGFAGLFLIVSGIAFWVAITADSKPSFTAEESIKWGQKRGEIAFEIARAHGYEALTRERFVPALRANRGDFGGIPEAYVDLYIDAAWESYSKAWEEHLKVDW